MYKHILVTGGAGFAGSWLCLALAREAEGVRITALDNLHRRGSERNLPRLRAAGVGFVYGDIRQPGDLEAVIPPPDLIVECSAEPSAQAGYGKSPDYLIQTNLTGGYHCLELARRFKADVLFVSTSRVYPYRSLNSLSYTEEGTRFSLTAKQTTAGASKEGISEEFPLEGPRSLYGMTKLAAELMVEEYADAYGLRYIIDRFGLLAGPRQMGKTDQGVVVLWAAAHHYGRDLAYIGFGGQGKQVRDVLHVKDFCDLVLDQVRNFEAYAGRRFNAGGGRSNSVSLLELTTICREVTGKQIGLAGNPDTRSADVRIYITDHQAVSAVRGWRPKRDVRRTIADVCQWLDEEGTELEAILFGSAAAEGLG